MLKNKLFLIILFVFQNLTFCSFIDNTIIDMQFGGAFKGTSQYNINYENHRFSGTVVQPYKVSLKMGYVFDKLLLAPIIKSELKFKNFESDIAKKKTVGFSLFGGLSKYLKVAYAYMFVDMFFGYSNDRYWIDPSYVEEYMFNVKIPVFQVCPGLQFKLFKNIDFNMSYNFNVLFNSDISEIKNNTLYEIESNKIRHDFSCGLIFFKHHK